MTTEHIEGRDELARYVPWIGAAVVLAVAIPVGILRGAPAVVLWLAFTALASAVLLFWEAMRTALDPTSAGDATDTDDEGVPAELETRKRAALQALRDIEFERSIGRLSEDDFKALEVKYRDEARAAMRAIDEGLGPWLARAEAMLKTVEAPVDAPTARAEAEAEVEAAAAPAPKREVVCAKCEATNDDDAVFCKKCGTRVAAEVSDAT